MTISLQQWRRDLYILTACQFLIQMGFSLVMPFLPLYIEQNLGVTDPGKVQLWAGAAFSATFASAAFFSPIWGRLADRKGRKLMMLRSGYGMAIVVSLMGFARGPVDLIVLRVLQGVVAGFIPAAVAYMATNTPRERTGFALGVMQTGGTAGTIIGPLAGGALAHVMGYSSIFLLTGLACFVAGTIVLILIKERPRTEAEQQAAATSPGWSMLRGNPVLLAMFVVLFLTMLSLMTAEPILSLYLSSLNTAPEYVALLSGMIFSSSGFANIFAAPLFGRLGDRRGYRRVLLITLAGSAAAYALQGLAVTAWDLLLYRFVLGIFIGGTLPAANALIAQSAGAGSAGQAFGLTNSAIFLGNMLGPLVGSGVSYAIGMRAVFFVTAAIRLINVVWVARALPAQRTAGVAVSAPGTANIESDAEGDAAAARQHPRPGRSD